MKENQEPLINDPEYRKLLACYQDAQFDQCEELLDILDKRYPDNHDLAQFKDDLLVKKSFQNSILLTNKEERRKKKKKILKMSLFAVGATFIIGIIFLSIYFLVGVRNQTKQLEKDNLLLASLHYQAEKLLESGKPSAASEIVEQMKTINADYQDLPELISRTEDLVNLEEKYQNALDLIQQDKNSEALELLYSIQEQRPNMWDVNYQIELIEKNFEICSCQEEGNSAFIAEDWDGVIEAYENVIALDPSIDDPLMNEQLIQAYLNKIIGMLDNETTSIEDIDNAEDYYRKALSLVSQSKAFATERENLQNASSDLLQLKYTQIAKDALSDKNQTSTTVAEAVSYIRKASNLDPENKALNADLTNAEYYQMAFKNFLDLNWDQTISYLKILGANDPNYANGNANILLFEAYYALGKQYSSLGLYLDAIKVFEEAEILAWADSENLLKLFQVQTYLGQTFGKLGNYEDAVSYYQYAFNATGIDRQLLGYPELSKKLSNTNVQVAYQEFKNAFEGYREITESISVIYSKAEAEITDGACLAFFAAENQSTIEAIIKENNLPSSMNITFGRRLIVPTIEK